MMRISNAGGEPAPMASKALPATLIDRTFGLCTCWLCKERLFPKRDHEWMFDTLARHALAMPDVDRSIWIQDWTLRHGKFAGAVLNRHIDKLIAFEGGKRE